MITGRVRNNRIWVDLRVFGKDGREAVVEAVIDTGYTGALTLPTSIVSQLQLTWERRNKAFLADGTPLNTDEFEAYISWDGEKRKISIDQFDSVPLFGMSLLYNHELKVHVYPAGKVQIKRLRRS